MSKFKLFARYWLPVVLWGLVIFSASSDKASVQHSRIIEPFIRWLIPDISAAALDHIVFGARKCAHLTEFAIFTLVLWRAFRGTCWRDRPGWLGRVAWSAWGLAVAFAATDEWHQLYVPGRQGSVWDVLIDSIGGAGGLLVFWCFGRWRKKW